MGNNLLRLQERSSRRRQGVSHDITYRTVQARPQDVTLGRPQDVIFQRPKDVGRGRPLASDRGPYGDVHKTSFGDVPRTSLGRAFGEWGLHSQKMQAATRIEIHRIFFVRLIFISFPKFQEIVADAVTFFTKTQSYTPQNSTKHHHRCFHEDFLEHLHRKLWKISRKKYLVQF